MDSADVLGQKSKTRRWTHAETSAGKRRGLGDDK